MKDFNELIGLTIDQVKEKLGYWWLCTGCKVNPPVASYIFDRNGGRVEIWTERNVVTSVYRNPLAEFYAERDATREKGREEV